MRLKCIFLSTLIVSVVVGAQGDGVQDVETIDLKGTTGDLNPVAAAEVQPPVPSKGSNDPSNPNYDSKHPVELAHPQKEITNNNNESSINDAVDIVFNHTSTTQKRGRSGRLTTYYAADYDPMTSNVAPPDNDQRGYSGVGYTMTDTRLAEIRKNFMYPYYDKGGNADNEGDYQKEIQSSTPQVHKNLNFQLPFYGFRYNYTRVSLNGYLEFSDPPPNFEYPLDFPIKDWPKKNDPAFIGIFYSKCRIGNLRDEDVDRRKPGVYFRLERDLRTRKDRMGVEIRERLKWDIREGVIGSESFRPKHAIIATWKNVSFNGGFANALYKTNTFQMVLATDEVMTYAIFNYLNLDWTTHTEAGGDTRTGEGGKPAFVGFNAGNGTRAYAYAPYSQESVIRDLTATGWGNNFKGRHIFRIDENILTGSCNKDIDGTNLKLMIAPESGNMLGGTVVNITGPCFNLNDRVRCKFDLQNEVAGYVIDRNRAICIQPFLYAEGWVNLYVAIGNQPFKWQAKYYVESPAMATQKIYFKDSKIHEKSPSEIRISWEKQNLTTNENANIRLSLWGYREVNIRPTFVFITELAANIQNTGEYTIIPSTFRTRTNEFLTDIKYGFLQLNLTESVQVHTYTTTQTTVDITPLVWSRPIPLGWYFQFQWENMYGSKWPEQLCNDWLMSDRYMQNFAHELPQCPCTIQQALADKGRYMPDFDCDKDTNPICYYNNQALHCVKTGSPTLQGSEQQCCYDKNGYLMLSYDQQWGSSPRRCHNLGNMPYNEITKVPTLSQWYNDMVPKYLCCLWQGEQAVGCETLRFERRPTQSCVAYQAPGVAGVYGDPHLVTFDDVEYTFNGKGEFVLVKSKKEKDNLEVQGRFEQMEPNAYGEVRATQLTAIVAKGNTSTTVEVRRRPFDARWRYRLDVIANDRMLYFDRPSLKFQHFPGVTVYTPTYILNQSEVIIMFDNGAGVEVVENQGYMSARVYLPWGFINKTYGLMGNWSFNKEDDFTLPDGTKVAPISANSNDMERIYNDFGMKWMLDDVDDGRKGRSYFFREFGRTAANYNNKTFKPEFNMRPEDIIPQNRTERQQQLDRVNQMCSTDMYECYYDYAMTLNREVAHFTQNYKSSIYQIKDTTRTKVISCGVLETPRFGRKSTFLFVPGTKVQYDCDQDFVLVGDPRRECLANGQWDVPDYGYTECLREQEYASRTAAITWGIILAVLIPLVLLILFIGYKGFQKYKQNQEEDNNSYNDSTKPKTLLAYNRTSSVPEYDDDDYPSSSDSTSKKRRSYDKSYRTHEPLPGLPDNSFEEKPWDPNNPDYYPEDEQALRSPTQSLSPRVSQSPPSSMIYDRPDVVKPTGLDYNTDDYSMPTKKKPKDRNSSQGSVVTDV